MPPKRRRSEQDLKIQSRQSPLEHLDVLTQVTSFLTFPDAQALWCVNSRIAKMKSVLVPFIGGLDQSTLTQMATTLFSRSVDFFNIQTLYYISAPKSDIRLVFRNALFPALRRLLLMREPVTKDLIALMWNTNLLPSLTSITFSNLTFSTPDCFDGLTHKEPVCIQELILGNTNLNNTILGSMNRSGAFRNVERLVMKNIPLDLDYSLVANMCPKLRFLSLFADNSSQRFAHDNFLGRTCVFPFLEALEISGKISKPKLLNLTRRNYPILKSLTLTSADVDDQVFCSILREWPNLKTLAVSGHHLTNSAVLSDCKIETLNVSNVQDRSVVDALMAGLPQTRLVGSYMSLLGPMAFILNN